MNFNSMSFHHKNKPQDSALAIPTAWNAFPQRQSHGFLPHFLYSDVITEVIPDHRHKIATLFQVLLFSTILLIFLHWIWYVVCSLAFLVCLFFYILHLKASIAMAEISLVLFTVLFPSCISHRSSIKKIIEGKNEL